MLINVIFPVGLRNVKITAWNINILCTDPGEGAPVPHLGIDRIIRLRLRLRPDLQIRLRPDVASNFCRMICRITFIKFKKENVEQVLVLRFSIEIWAGIIFWDRSKMVKKELELVVYV